MKKIIQFPNPNETFDEACVWLTLLDAGASTEEKETFAKWLESSEQNATTFVKVASLWDQMSILNELSEIFPLTSYSENKSHVRNRFIATFMLVLGLFIGGMAYITNYKYVTDSYITGVGEQKTMLLSDGTKIIINTDSILHVNYTKQERRIVLERGEGHFKVAKNGTWPFRVYVGSRVVEAVGTAFTVQRNREDRLEVVVTEGAVNLISLPDVSELSAASPITSEKSEDVSLSAGEYAEVLINNKDDAVQKKKMPRSDIEAKLAWREGMLLFQGESLGYVVQEVSRYTKLRIEAEQSIKDIAVHGYFRAGDINGLLITMQENFQVDARHFSDEYILLVKKE